MQKYPFQIDAEILNLVADISELTGQLSTHSALNSSPQLRHSNRIRTIYSSLAIEQNTLSLDQVTAVIAGKRVLAPPKDVAEVQNAYEIYDRMDGLDPYAIDDLLLAHGIMMRGLVTEAGEFRSKPVGVVDTRGNILHFGTLPDYVPSSVAGLLEWTAADPQHILIKSCVFHYEFELIHPFSDGNGRVGRLWHTLLLSKWSPIFAWLPVESIIHDRQEEYYRAFNKANLDANSTVFIKFMLSAILDAMREVINEPSLTAKSKADRRSSRDDAVLKLLEKQGEISNSDIRRLLNISPATANRILNELSEKGSVTRFRKGKTWAYRRK